MANVSGKGYKIDEFGFPLVSFSHLIHVGKKLSDEPFIIVSQAFQVFYVKDERHKNWVVIVKTKAMDIYDVGIGVLYEEDDEEDNYYENIPYNITIDDAYDDVNDNLNCTQADVEGITIDTSSIVEENFTDDESNDVEENFTDDESDNVAENFSKDEFSDN